MHRSSIVFASLLLASLPLVGPVRAADGSKAPSRDNGVPRLGDIVVTGTRTEKRRDETPVRTEVVGRQEIRDTAASTLKEALANVPGLQLHEIHGKSGYHLSMQGLGSDQVLVLIDGLPISASTGSSVDLSQYLVSDVERIEVVKGAASAQYGSSAMGGVVNVITRRPQEGFSGDVELAAGSRGRQNASGKRADAALRQVRTGLQGGSGQLRGRLAYDRLGDDGFSVDPAGWTRQGDRIRREQLTGRLFWTLRPGTEFTAELGRYEENDLQRFTTFAPPRRIPQDKTEDIDRNRLVLGARHRLEHGSVVNLRGLDERYRAHSTTHSNGVATIDRFLRSRLGHLSLQWDLPPLPGQTWQLGADLHRERVEQTQNGASELVGNGAVRRNSRELYLQGDIFLTSAWELVPGVRWQDDSDFGGHWAPKLAVRGRVFEAGDRSLTLRASVGRGYRVPNLKERHYLFDHSALGYKVLGNPALRPESSTSLQAGAVLVLERGWTVDVNAYYNRVRDLIQTDTNRARTDNGVAIYTYSNVARARTQGIETELGWRPDARWRVALALTLGKTRDLETGREIAQRPKRVGRLALDWQALPRTRLSVRVRHQSSELSDVTNNLRSDPWTTVDLGIRQQLVPGLSAFLDVDNLFDRQRDFSQAHQLGPISGRLVMLGLRWGFAGSGGAADD